MRGWPVFAFVLIVGLILIALHYGWFYRPVPPDPYTGIVTPPTSVLTAGPTPVP